MEEFPLPTVCLTKMGPPHAGASFFISSCRKGGTEATPGCIHGASLSQAETGKLSFKGREACRNVCRVGSSSDHNTHPGKGRTLQDTDHMS